MIKIMFAQFLMLIVLMVVEESMGTSINARTTRDLQSSNIKQVVILYFYYFFISAKLHYNGHIKVYKAI